ncbi:MAG: alpha-2-macroglobulin family protein, partial [Ardenticatenaceae bacterium]
LLTFERGSTRRAQPIELTAPLTILEVLIQPDDAPNIFVTVNAWQAQDTMPTQERYSSLPDSRLHSASVELLVPVTGKRLTVTITPDKEQYAPREEATFVVRVTDEQNRPGPEGVPAELSLALVDEAIFSLSEELSGPIFDAFYAEREHLVRTYDSMALTRYFGDRGGGGGGGGPLAANPRRDFSDSAAWVPVLRTDANGVATFTLTLPDNLTTWRLTAKAITADETLVGEAFVNVLTRQPVVVRPILPRSLTAGDELALSAVVHNFGDEQTEIEVSLVVDPERTLAGQSARLAVTSPPTQSIALEPGAQRIVGWSAMAIAAGEVALDVRADAGEAGDAVRLTLPIRPLAIPQVESQVGEFNGYFSTTLTLPSEALELGSVRVELSRSIAGSLLTGLEYLTGYPYGCVEQTMSRALPNAVVGRAFHRLGVGNPTVQADLPAQINAGLQRLYGYQHNDGGWGWWYDDSSHDYQSAWVVFGLAVTAEAGHEVDPGVIERGAEWLQTHLPDMDPRTQAYALYSLAVAGHGDLAATRALVEEAEGLDTFSQAALALALHELNASDEALTLLDLVAERATVRDGDVFWPNTDEDGYYNDKTMASTTRSTALALSAFARIAPNHDLVPGIVRWLMSQRRQQGWGSTNETSFAILALTDHLLATQELIGTDTEYSVALNGQFLAGGTLGPNEPAVTVDIPTSQMAHGQNQLEIRQRGGGRLYYVINHRMYLPESAIAAAGDVRVTRAYLDPQNDRPIRSAAPGELVKVQLNIVLPDDGFFIIVEDNLPGGLEALNDRLNTSSHQAVAHSEPYFYWQEYGYNNKEVHGDRVSFFITELSQGEHTFSYFARTTHAGHFVAMPTELYAMYDLTVWGRSASALFEIVE